jgi:hypothetical protein
MSGVNILISTDSPHGRNHLIYWGADSYRIATEIRNVGYTCKINDFFRLKVT